MPKVRIIYKGGFIERNIDRQQLSEFIGVPIRKFREIQDIEVKL